MRPGGGPGRADGILIVTERGAGGPAPDAIGTSQRRRVAASGRLVAHGDLAQILDECPQARLQVVSYLPQAAHLMDRPRRPRGALGQLGRTDGRVAAEGLVDLRLQIPHGRLDDLVASRGLLVLVDGEAARGLDG